MRRLASLSSLLVVAAFAAAVTFGQAPAVTVGAPLNVSSLNISHIEVGPNATVPTAGSSATVLLYRAQTGDPWVMPSDASQPNADVKWASDKLQLSNGTDRVLQFIQVEAAGRPTFDATLFSEKQPGLFKESVQEDLSLIAKQIAPNGPINVAVDGPGKSNVRVAFEDLERKNDWVRAHKGDGANPLVELNVATRSSSGTTVPNCEVWYALSGWIDSQDHWKRFDAFSSPTKQLLPVGNYLIWAVRDGKSGPKTPTSPGDDERASKSIDLLAPDSQILIP